MSGQISIRSLTQVERDAETGWDTGDLVFVPTVGLTSYTGSSWTVVAGSGGAVPEVPATPDAQDIVDALVTLGLVTQAGA